MNSSPNNEKLEKYLDELADEYKSLLFKSFISRSKSLDDLSVSELLRLDAEIKKPLLENYQRQQKRRRVFLIAGLTYMFLGFLLFIMYEIIGFSLTHDTATSIIPLMSVVIGFIGLFMALVAFAFPVLRLPSTKHENSMKEESPALLEHDVVTKWRELEGIVNDISINVKVNTPRSIIEFLSENHFIDTGESTLLREFLKMRNNIVHSSGNVYVISEIKEMIVEIDKIITKLKKIV